MIRSDRELCVDAARVGGCPPVGIPQAEYLSLASLVRPVACRGGARVYD
jgi:hypothetical protein